MASISRWPGSLLPCWCSPCSVITRCVATLAKRYASAFPGGRGPATALALFIAQLFSGGLRITGVLGTLLVWLVSVLGTFLFPFWWLKEKRNRRQAARKE